MGSFYFKDYRKYEGEWKNNKMHGYGIISWPDGKFFEGEFYEDKKEGFGVYYSNKKIYIGMWKNSLLNGYCIIIENGKIKKQIRENGKAIKNLDTKLKVGFEDVIPQILENKDEMGNLIKKNSMANPLVL